MENNEELRNRLIKSIAFETGANVGLDYWTNWLLGTPVPGSRVVYGAANFLGSSAINLVAQRIRGEEGVKWGEVGASGATSIIPFMNPALTKAQKLVGKPMSIQRGIVGGAATGLTHEGIRIGIDEQRLPSLQEAALGAGVGGVGGGAITGISKGIQKAVTLRKNLKKSLPTPEETEAAELYAMIEYDTEDTNVIYNLPGIKSSWFHSTTPNLAEPASRQVIRRENNKLVKKFLLQRSQLPNPDINLKDYDFQNNPQDYQNFEMLMHTIMEADDIRKIDIPFFSETSPLPLKGKKSLKNFRSIAEIYNDYLLGYFNRWIKPGIKENFNDAVRLTLPDGISTVPINNLLREMKAFTLSPSSYKSGAFKPTSSEYQEQVAELAFMLRGKKKEEVLANVGKNIKAHHKNIISEGFPLIQGLPDSEIPIMAQMAKDYDLPFGNESENLLLLFDLIHKRLHRKYWPDFKPDWDLDVLRSITTAEGRREYLIQYVDAINRMNKHITDKTNRYMEYHYGRSFEGPRYTQEEFEKIIIPGILEGLDLTIHYD